MSDSEASEDIEGEEVRSTDGSDTPGSLCDFVVEDGEDDADAEGDSCDDSRGDAVDPRLIVTGKRKRTVRESDSPLESTDEDDSDWVE